MPVRAGSFHTTRRKSRGAGAARSVRPLHLDTIESWNDRPCTSNAAKARRCSMKKEATTAGSGDAVALAHLLATAATGDTLMRDIYLARARALLDPICPEGRYRASLEERTAIDRLLAQSRAAVGRQDWAQVEELAGRAAQLRRPLDSDASALEVAEEVYGAHPVALDPFSRGLEKFATTEAGSARSDTLPALERLGRAGR